MSTVDLAPSVAELAELHLERQAALEAEWVRLCLAFVTDRECNRGSSVAKDLVARLRPQNGADLLRFLKHSECPFQFPVAFGFSGRHRWRLVWLFLRYALFPVAQEVIRRGQHRDLTQMAMRDLLAEAALGLPGNRINPEHPEGVSDEAYRHGLDFGVLGQPAPASTDDKQETLVGTRAPWMGLLARSEAFFAELKMTQRFGSKRGSAELRRCRKNFRHLVEHAFPEMWTEGDATCRIHLGSRRATGLLAKARAPNAATTRESDAEDLAISLTGRTTELAGLAILRTAPTERRRVQRVARHLKRRGMWTAKSGALRGGTGGNGALPRVVARRD